MKRNGKKVGRSSFVTDAERALREAVAEVIESRKRTRELIVVWHRGKVVRVHPQPSLVREAPARKYGR